jgi:hypothetical protein
MEMVTLKPLRSLENINGHSQYHVQKSFYLTISRKCSYKILNEELIQFQGLNHAHFILRKAMDQLAVTNQKGKYTLKMTEECYTSQQL